MREQAQQLYQNQSQIGKYGQKYLLIIWVDGDTKTVFSDQRSDLKNICKELAKFTNDIEAGSPEYLSNDNEYYDCGMSQKNTMINFANWFNNFNDNNNQ